MRFGLNLLIAKKLKINENDKFSERFIYKDIFSSTSFVLSSIGI